MTTIERRLRTGYFGRGEKIQHHKHSKDTGPTGVVLAEPFLNSEDNWVYLMQWSDYDAPSQHTQEFIEANYVWATD